MTHPQVHYLYGGIYQNMGKTNTLVILSERSKTPCHPERAQRAEGPHGSAAIINPATFMEVPRIPLLTYFYLPLL